MDERASSRDRLLTPGEVAAILDRYASAFVRLTPIPPEIGPLLELLASRYPVAILSNWPIAIAVERYIEAAGWSPHLSAVVISQRVGARVSTARARADSDGRERTSAAEPKR